MNTYNFYLNSKPFEVITVDEIVDNTAGTYPCYYTVKDNRLRISGSAYALIKDLGNFVQNKNLRIGLYATSYQTHDTRVMRIKPFEKLYYREWDGQLIKTNMFTSADNLDLNGFIDKEAELLKKHINAIEKLYPDAIHIAEVGGKDSQIILLIPKLSKNWYVFSAQPNYPLVKQFIELNNIDINMIYTSDGEDELWDEKFIEEKIVALDGLQALLHLRWGKSHREMVKEFGDKKVIFWDGDSGGNLNSPLNINRLARGNRTQEMFFRYFWTCSPLHQGATHQYYKHLGMMRLDIYSLSQLWEDVFMQYNPINILKRDIRKQLGDKIFGKPVKWIDENPAPPAWRGQLKYDIRKIYCDYIGRNIGNG